MYFLDELSLLDPHWLSTLLETVFAIFIFLIGVPLLLTHMFIPEEIRRIYSQRRMSSQIKELWPIGIILFLFVFPFACHPVKNYIQNSKWKYSEQILNLILIFTILLFCIYCIRVVIYLKKKFSEKDTYVKEIMEQIVKKDIIKGKIPESTVVEVQTIGGAVKTPNAKRDFIDGLKEITFIILKSPNYTGRELKALLNSAILEATIENSSLHDYKDLKKIYSLCNEVILKHTKENSEDDRNIALDCLAEISKLCIKYDDDELFVLALGTLFESRVSNKEVRELCLAYFEKGKPQFTALKADKYLDLLKTSGKNTREQKYGLKNSIILFAWLNSTDNNQTLQFVRKKLTPAIVASLIKQTDLEKARDSLYTSYDFVSAEKVQKLIDDFFGQQALQAIQSKTA